MSTFDAVLNSRKFQRWFPWMAGLVLVAGIVAALVLLVPNTSGTADEKVAPPENAPAAQRVEQQKLLKQLPPEARRVAGKFILTAVAREKLGEAWPLAGPDVRQGMTRKEWMTGNIAVAPFFGGIDQAPMSVDYVTKNEAVLQVLLIPKAKGKQYKPAVFYVRVNKIKQGGKPHWVVNEVTQRVGVPIPANPNN